MKRPRVTVSMAVYNGATYLNAAIESILNQTFDDLELLIVNDGSTDATKSIVNSYSDSRIRLIDNDCNRGIAYSRNRGWKEANGDFVAVLDCDDIAVKYRIESQYAHLIENPALAMTGGHAEVINSNGQPTGDYYIMPTHPGEVSIELLFRNVFVNSTVMFRKEAIERVGGYWDSDFVEDYELAFRINEHHPVDNIDRVLVQYRLHEHNISSEKEALMREGEEHMVKYMHQILKIPYDAQLQTAHLSFIRALPGYKMGISDYFQVLKALKTGNDKTGVFPKEEMGRIFMTKWYEMIRQSKSRSSLSLFFKKPLFDSAYATQKMYRKMFKQAFGIV
jgi:glycosyltransferase involved in cell wall biosynthesis